MRKNKFKIRTRILLLTLLMIEIIVLCVTAISVKMSSSRDYYGNYSGEMELVGGEWQLTDTALANENAREVLQVEYANLPAGLYAGTIRYQTDQTQEVTFDCSMPEYVEMGKLFLDHRKEHVDFCFTIKAPVDSFSLKVRYKGGESFTISPLNLHTSRRRYVKDALCVLFVLAAIQILAWIFGRYPDQKRTVAAILGISLLAFLPYLFYGLYSSGAHDFAYHYNRIEGVVDALKAGQFPVYMQPLWMNGYGSPVSLYYGDALLYIPAALRIAGFTFNAAYKLFVFLVNLGTATISYFSFRAILGGTEREEHADKIALVLSLAYTCAPYRLIDLYLRVAVGEYLAMMFFPLVVRGLYRIFTSRSKEKYWKEAAILGIGMTGILTSHLLSFQMVLLFVVAFAIIAAIARNMSLARIKALVFAALEAGMLSLFFLIPFLDSYLHNKTIISARVKETAAIQKNGAFVGQLFAFFQDIFGDGQYAKTVDKMYLSIGGVLSCAVLFAIVALVSRKRIQRRGLLWLGLSLLTLFMSTDVFPWDIIARSGKLGNTMAQIQFPWRYLSFATFFAALLLGELLRGECSGAERYRRRFGQICLVLSAAVFLETAYFSSNYFSGAEREAFYNVDQAVIGDRDIAEYLREGTKKSDLTYKMEANNVTASVIERTGTRMQIQCQTENEGGELSLPVFNYKGYVAHSGKGETIEIKDGINDEITLSIPPDFHDTVNVEFRPPRYWLAAWWASLLSALGLGLIIVMRLKRRRTEQVK